MQKKELFIVHHFIESLLFNQPALLKIVLGLSGGPDSVYLFHQLLPFHKRKEISLNAAHLDHGWRPNSLDDANFCRALCSSYAIPYYQAHAKDFEPSIPYQGSKEEHGRNLRRAFFEKIRSEIGAHYIALAHHRQDQEETFLLRLTRGATLQGLIGMRPVEGHYLRPLLDINKEQIYAYLMHHKISFMVDPSNESKNFLRNKIRHDVIPALEKCDTRFRQKFHDTLENLRHENDFLEKLTDDVFTTVFKSEGDTSFIGNLKEFLKCARVLQMRLIVLWLSREHIPFTPSRGFLNEIHRFVTSPRGGIHAIGPHLKLFKKSQRIWFEKE